MDLRLKHRLVGGALLITVGVIFIPMLLDGPPPAPQPVALEAIPPRPDASFVPQRIDLNLPERPVVSAVPEPVTDAAGDLPEKREAQPGMAVAWVIQVGSFSRADNALALRDQLRKGGYTAFTEPVPGARDQTRVRIGPELDRRRLERQLTKLRKDERFANALILHHR